MILFFSLVGGIYIYRKEGLRSAIRSWIFFVVAVVNVIPRPFVRFRYGAGVVERAFLLLAVTLYYCLESLYIFPNDFVAWHLYLYNS